MGNFSSKTKLFIIGTILLGLAISPWYIRDPARYGPGLIALAALAAVAQVLKVEGATNKSSYNISWLVYGFTFVLLGSPATLFVILVAHLVEWIWHRYTWYIQTFNMANYALALFAADLVYHSIQPLGNPANLAPILAILAAFIVFTLVNHFLVGMVILMARGQSFAQSGVFDPLTLMIDLSLIGMGAGAVLIWLVNPYGVILILLPLYLIYSTLKVPALQRQTELDPKTKLYNARYFADALEKELSRAKWFNRPLTLVMGDLDLLRNINNTYGHLAGDAVLIGVAEILQSQAREYDVVARFGGEEFAILMPETTPEEAHPIIETIRREIEEAGFEVSTSITPIQATMSFGITERTQSDQTSTAMIHSADLALYHSKLKGRNLITIHQEEYFNAFFNHAPGILNDKMEESLEARIDRAGTSFTPDPLREQRGQGLTHPGKSANKELASEKELKKSPPAWHLPIYIGSLAALAITLAGFTFRIPLELDWLALITLALLVALTEILSIEIYVKETSISTSTVPLIVGALLFGSLGALVLSLTLATTAFIKNRSRPHKFIFNTSNHIIYTSFIAFITANAGAEFIRLPIPNQIMLSLTAGLICYFSSTAFLAGAMGISSGESIRQVWAERFCWLWPYYVTYGVVIFLVSMGYAQIGIIGILITLIPLFIIRISQFQYIDHTRRAVQELRGNNQQAQSSSNASSQRKPVAAIPPLQWAQTDHHARSTGTGELVAVERVPELGPGVETDSAS